MSKLAVYTRTCIHTVQTYTRQRGKNDAPFWAYPQVPTWEACLRNCAFGEVSEVEEKVGPKGAAWQRS